MNGVTAAIFAPLDIAVLVLMGDNLAGSSGNCECCRKTKIMQKKFFRKNHAATFLFSRNYYICGNEAKSLRLKNFHFQRQFFTPHNEISLSIAKHTGTNMPE